MKTPLVILGVLFAAAVAAVFYGVLRPAEESASRAPASAPEASVVLAPLAKSDGGVEVTATPTFQDGRIVFRIDLSTHVVELDNDLLADAELLADGTAVNPVAWDGDPPGGHHRSGTLTFPAISAARSLELRIYRVGGVPERTFAWNLAPQRSSP